MSKDIIYYLFLINNTGGKQANNIIIASVSIIDLKSPVLGLTISRGSILKYDLSIPSSGISFTFIAVSF